jgi:hypothetical protein
LAKLKQLTWKVSGYNTCENREEMGVFQGANASRMAHDRAREWRDAGHYVQVVIEATS